MLPTLDERLSTAAALVREGEPVADIGCDHGKLTAVLAASGRYPKVIGADLRSGPLEKARLTLKNAGCADKVELRQGDGLSVLSEGEVGTIVLAGVSAKTTQDILAAAPWIFGANAPRLVLVPATRHPNMREWLYRTGYTLLADHPVQAAGRWYTVIAAEYTGEKQDPTLEQCLYGETRRWENTEPYRALERAKLAKYRLSLADTSPFAAEIDALLQRDGVEMEKRK